MMYMALRQLLFVRLLARITARHLIVYIISGLFGVATNVHSLGGRLGEQCTL